MSPGSELLAKEPSGCGLPRLMMPFLLLVALQALSLTFLTPAQLSGFYQAGQWYARASKNGTKNMIQIGANDGRKNNNAEVMSILQGPNTKAVLVEGNPSVFRRLQTNVQRWYDPTLQRIIPLNALVCEEGKRRTFYTVDVDKIKHASRTPGLRLPHWVAYQISSLEKNSTRDGLAHYLRTSPPHFWGNETASEFIQEISLECVSFRTILARAPFDARDVDVLAVDVEGFDAHVLLESFAVPGLEPPLVVFEAKSAALLFPDKFDEVLDTLHGRGYETNCAARGHRRRRHAKKLKSKWVCSDEDAWARKKKQKEEDETRSNSVA